eukprot:2978900-Alexandrium_andersonii.AAC.1
MSARQGYRGHPGQHQRLAKGWAGHPADLHRTPCRYQGPDPAWARRVPYRAWRWRSGEAHRPCQPGARNKRSQANSAAGNARSPASPSRSERSLCGSASSPKLLCYARPVSASAS